MMMAQGGVSLPAGYTKIEYLESDGNSYIDTGFKPNQDTRVVMDAELNSQSSYPKVLFGARNGSTTSDASFIVWAFTANGFRTDFGSKSLVTTVVPTGRFVIDKNKNVTSFNGIEYTNPAYTFQCDYNIGLFTQIDVDGPDDRLSTAKLYSCKIYDNGVLVRDFIPCTNPDGISGLWDSVNDMFYKMLPADYTRLDFIESDGTTYIDTGFKPNNNTRVVFKGYSNSSLSGWIFGSWASATSNQFAASCLATYSIRYGTKNAQPAAVTVGDVNIDMNKNKYTYNGASGSFDTQTFSSSYPIYLFAINDAGRVSSGKFYGKLYSCQIYDNGTLVRDFIPAMNASGEAGLYDLKNDVWYALKPVVTKKKNKITLSLSNGGMTTPDGSIIPVTNGRIVAEEKVTSNVSATIRGDDGIAVINPSLTIFKGAIRSTYNQLGFGNSFYIYSISPTEDDTYIYTF